MRKLTLAIESWKTKKPFHITGRVFDVVDFLYVEIKEGGYIGRGEAAGIYYFGETGDSILADAEQLQSDIQNGLSKEQLHHKLGVGGARNALDCALWDLQAKQTGQSIWQLTNLSMKPVHTVNTLGIDSAKNMAASAKLLDTSIIKIKLDAEQPIERMRAVYQARPDARFVVDINQGWNFGELVIYAPELKSLGVMMIEQPLPRGADSELEGYDCPIDLCADESCIASHEVTDMLNRYQMINIKLDKTGGLSEALKTAETARQHGLKLMVGNMLGTSLSMAPAFVIAQLCEFVDIDGPVLLADDRDNKMDFSGGNVTGFSCKLWG